MTSQKISTFFRLAALALGIFVMHSVNASAQNHSVTTGTGTISSTSGMTDTGNHCDDCTAAITLPFSYQFYGASYSSAVVSSNGNLQFTGTATNFGNGSLPDARFTNTIFAHWDDLRTDASGAGIWTSTTGTAPNRTFNVVWKTNYFGMSGTAEFEVRLYEGQQKFDIIYGVVSQNASDATIGVQKNDSDYTQYSANTPINNINGLRLTFTRTLNSAPVLPVISNQTTAWGNPVSFTAVATDAPGSILTYSLINAPSGASINSSSGEFTWTPTSSQIGSHTFTVQVADNGTPSLSAQQNVTVNVNKRPVTLSYTGSDSGQYSDQATLSAQLVDAGTGNPIIGKTINFGVGNQQISASTSNSGIAAANLIINQEPCLPALTASVAEDSLYLGALFEDTFFVDPEDARVTYNGTLYKATANSSQNTASVTLSAIIKDISAVNPSDTTAGNITNAMVDFVDLDNPNSPPLATAAVTLASNNDSKIGLVSAPVTLDTGGANAKTFNIGIFVTGYYDRVATEDNILVTIAKPVSTNFISGGGFLKMQQAFGAAPETLANFGLNVRHGANGTNPVGGYAILLRNGSSVYQISGNAFSAPIAVNNSNPLARKAIISATNAIVTDITNPLAPITVTGNFSVQFKLTDKGEPGTADSIGIQIMDGNTLWFSSRTDGDGGTAEQTLSENNGAGNLVFRYVSSPR